MLYREKGAAYEEIAHGGVGISHLAIRSYVKEKLARLKREARQHSVQASRLGASRWFDDAGAEDAGASL